MNEYKSQKTKVHRKLKYGCLSVGFAVVVVILCIGLNLLMSGLSAKWDLRVDITDTKARFYTISDATRETLAKHFEDDPDWKITIRFLAPEDKISDVMIAELARSYAAAFEGHIDLVFNDIYGDPELADRYERLTHTALTPMHVIIEGKYHTRAYGFPAFYYFDSESGEKFSFAGEKTFTTAIVRAGLKEVPKAVFTVGHGESIDNFDLSRFEGESSVKIEQGAYLVPLFDSLYEMGFEVQAVDLNKSEIPELTRLVIVCDPKYDFTGYDPEHPDRECEIDVLRKYMDGYASSLIVAVNDKTAALPNLSEYMEQEYGLGYVPMASVTDNDRSVKGSGGRVIFGSMPDSLKYSLDEKILRGFKGSERFSFGDTVRLTVSDDPRIQGEGVLMNSSPSAVSKGAAGRYPIFAFNTNAKAIEAPEGGSADEKLYKTAYLLGSTDFLSAKGLVSQYANRDLLESVLRVANTVQEYTAVKDVKFVSEALNISTGQARFWTVIVTFVVPLAVFAVAAAVWIKRRHS